MASPFMDLWDKVIAAVHPTVSNPSSAMLGHVTYGPYAENRRTHAPMKFNQGSKPDSTGVTIPPGSGSGLTYPDRADLIRQGIQQGADPSVLKFFATDAGKPKGAMYIHEGSNPNDNLNNTIRHETVHSVLDNAGLKSKELQGFMDSHPELRPVENAFNQAPASGDSALELPAYMAQPAPGFYNPTPEHRQAYLNAFIPWLQKQNPKAATQYQSLIDTPPVDNTQVASVSQ